MHRLFRLLFRAGAKTIAFRAETWLWLILEAIPLIILLMIWQGIYAQTNILGGVQFSTVVFYYIFVFLVDMLTAAHFESWRIAEIREGRIDFYLTKPLGYLSELSIRHVGDKLMSAVLKLPLFVGFIVLIHLLFHPTLPPIQIITLLQSVPLLLGAFILQFFLSTIIVLIGFWLENAEGLDHFRWLSTSLFSGIAIPFAFMPAGLLHLAQLLPFKYLHSVPVLVLLGQQTIKAGDYLYLTVTCFVLGIITLLLWQKARLRYSAYGG